MAKLQPKGGDSKKRINLMDIADAKAQRIVAAKHRQ
jgi:hypothetical protein